jgi:Na+-translocating ferredoxin:NAD+ oxidoreductase subunit B
MDGYEALMAMLDKFPTGAPPTYHLRRIVEIILTEPEAALAAKLMPHPFREKLSRLCDRIGSPPEVLRPLLESAADKGVVYCELRDNEPHYSLLPLAPGIFELQFMKGITDAKSKALAQLFHDYYFEGWGEKSFAVGAAFARIIAIEKEVPVGQSVQPYEQVKALIEGHSRRALTTCFCRHEHELIGKGCGRPKDVCMVLGPFVDYAVERGFARRASEAEMLDALERAETAGCVHLSDNVAEKISFICNCCGCCCGILGTITKLNIPTAVAHSPYIVAHDPDACIDCGDCVGRCQVGALRLDDGALKFDPVRCLGCGLCIRTCPQQALTLQRRPEAEVIKPFPSYFDMGMAIVRSMKRRR